MIGFTLCNIVSFKISSNLIMDALCIITSQFLIIDISSSDIPQLSTDTSPSIAINLFFSDSK